MEHDSTDSATVVVTQIITAGREGEYKRWQQRTIDAAREFEGFQGAAMYPPSSPENREWVVVYRFATVELLSAWATSEERRRLLNEGRAFFDSPPTLEMLAGKPSPRDVLTSIASHDVLPGKEDEFKDWQQRLTQAQELFPGFMGSELFPPIAGVQDHWVSLFRYDTEAHLKAWIESETRARLLREGRHYLRSFDLQTIKSPFSGWFGLDGREVEAAPGWKQGMTVLLTLFPISTLLASIGAPVFKAWHVVTPIAIFVILALSMIVMTWFLMPLVNRLLAFWLVPPGTNSVRKDVAGTALIVLCYLAVIGIAVYDFG